MLATLSADDVHTLEKVLCPDKPPTIWDWATNNLVLPTSESSSQGGFDKDRAGLFRRWLDVIAARRLRCKISETDPFADRTERLWGVTSAQLGKTINGIFIAAAWQAKHYPHLPMGIIWPRLELKKSQIRGRMEPLWQTTPALLDLMPEVDSEDYHARIGDRMWRLNNGLKIRMLVGSIANDLRANPLAALFADEYDAFPLDVGNQGNPLKLVEDRGRTWGADFLMVGKTTPTTVDGHGWKTLCQGTHERLLITCTACQGVDWLNPDQIKATEDADPTTIRRNDFAVWACKHCGSMHKTDAVRTMRDVAIEKDSWCQGKWEIDDDNPRGIWRPFANITSNGQLAAPIPPPDSETRSYHLNILYGKVWTLGRFYAEQAQALDGNSEDQQAFWNTARAEVWLPQGLPEVTEDEKKIIHTKANQLGTVPTWAEKLVLGFDQQGNTSRLCWFPWVLRAIGPDGKTQLVDCGKVESENKELTQGWNGVENLCLKYWPMENGEAMRPTLCIMDGANGNMAVKVRQWAEQDPSRKEVFWGNARLKPDEPWKRYVPTLRAKIPWPSSVAGWEVNSNYWRDRLDERRRAIPGAATWLLPENVPKFYLRSIWDSEVRVIKQRQVTGQGVREIIAWEPAQQVDSKGNITFRHDNHHWDIEVGIAAIAAIHNWDISGLVRAKRKHNRKYGSIGNVR